MQFSHWIGTLQLKTNIISTNTDEDHLYNRTKSAVSDIF